MVFGSSERLNTASPFNVKAKSITLRDFTATEVAQLDHQHTEDTGHRRYRPSFHRRRDKSGDPKTDGIAQLDRYLSRLELASGWLVIFERRSNAASIRDRVMTEVTTRSQGRSMGLKFIDRTLLNSWLHLVFNPDTALF